MSKYNERRAECEEALAILQEKLPITCLAELKQEDLEAHKHLLREIVYTRVSHVVEECERVNQAVQAMKAGDIPLLGKLLNASHASLKNKYEVTGVELDTLAESAQRQGACMGSRMIGGGFGGCTISIVKQECVEEFKKIVSKEYEDAIGYAPTFYEAGIGDGITIMKL